MDRSHSSAVFDYTPAFLKRIQSTHLSVDLVKLRLDSVRHLLDLPPSDEDVEDEEDEDELATEDGSSDEDEEQAWQFF